MKVWKVTADYYEADFWDIGIFTSLGIAACAAVNALNFDDGISGDCVKEIVWNASGTTCNINIVDSRDLTYDTGTIEIQQMTLNDF